MRACGITTPPGRVWWIVLCGLCYCRLRQPPQSRSADRYALLRHRRHACHVNCPRVFRREPGHSSCARWTSTAHHPTSRLTVHPPSRVRARLAPSINRGVLYLGSWPRFPSRGLVPAAPNTSPRHRVSGQSWRSARRLPPSAGDTTAIPAMTPSGTDEYAPTPHEPVSMSAVVQISLSSSPLPLLTG